VNVVRLAAMRDDELADLRARLDEAESTLDAIRAGLVDALVVHGPDGDQVYTMRSADYPYRLLVEHMQEGAVTVSEDGTILFANPRFAAMVGRPRDAVVNTALGAYVALPYGTLAALLAGGETRTEAELVAADGSVLPVSLAAAPVAVDDTRSVGVVITDLSWQKRTEALKRAHDVAAAANQAKDDFLAILSHELRSPLSAILTWARMLRLGRLDDGRTATALETIERSARLQVRLIEDLLDVSRIVSGKLGLERGVVELRDVVTASVESARGAAQARRIAVDTTLAAPYAVVRGDAARLEQIVDNLLSNAIKFTPEGGRIAVRLETAGSVARLTVTDSGPGIPAAFLPHMFDRFRQADTSSTRRHGGLGLGLAIARHLVDMHGGAIAAENRPQGGAVFSVELPLDQGAAATSRPGPAAPPLDRGGELADLRGVRVLVVDDDSDAQQAIAVILELSGAEVATATSAATALVAVTERRPDVLVTDIGMPDADGYDFMRRLRDHVAGDAIPAVALTGYASPADRDRALAAGFAVHLAKPVPPEELIDTVRQLVARRARP
jgi:PAS domain S-box-containing protein